MRRRTQPVDYGPITLEIADQSAISGVGGESFVAANSADVLKLKRLMGTDASGVITPEDLVLTQGDNAGEVTTTFDRTFQFHSQAYRILRLAISVARASSPIATSIKLRLTQDLLPGTELTVERHISGIFFDLRVSDATVLNNLAGILEELVLDLGQYLDTPIRMRLFRDVEDTPEASAAFHWDER